MMSDGSVSDDAPSRVVFLHEFEDGGSRDQVREAMAKRSKLGADALTRLFAGPPVVVKRGVNSETAFRYKRAIEGKGAKCRIEAMPAVEDADDQGYLERRQGERRQQPDRRVPTRTEMIEPDRRTRERRGSPEGGD